MTNNKKINYTNFVRSIHLKNYLFILFCTLGFQYAVNGQDVLLKTINSGEQLEMRWFPLRATLWDSLQQQGYGIIREEIVGTKIELTTGLKPNSEAWFEENADLKSGMYKIIGKLFYDSTYQYKGKVEGMSSLEIRYNYLLSEADNDQKVANDLGLSFIDTTLVNGKTYQYAITSGEVEYARIEIRGGDRGRKNNIKDYQLKFKFPNDKSLSDMRPRKAVVKNELYMIGKAYGDSIVLRWVPSNKDLWKKGQKQGYQLFRQRENASLMDSLGMIFPTPLDQLGKGIIKDSMALVASQVMYGEDELTNSEGFYDELALAENKFVMALHAAESSPQAANILAFRFVDKSVEKDANYQYYLRIIDAKGAPEIQTYSPKIKNEPLPLEAPKGFEAVTMDKGIMLQWKKEDPIYASYIIERSDDGGTTYQPLTNRPIVYLEDDRRAPDKYYYQDTKLENYKQYFYRLKGLDPFAEESRSSETTGMPKDLTAPPKPHIIDGELSEDKKNMTIKWGSTGTVPPDLDRYIVLLSRNQDSEYDSLAAFGKEKSSYSYKVEPDSIASDRQHYFRVMALDTAGNASVSEMYYIFYPDLISPEPPSNLRGEISDEGYVTLFWDHSTSKDATGYWVYVANNPEDEFAQAAQSASALNVFRDTIQDISLQEKIYYVVKTEDDAHNKSYPTQVLELKRPDKVPPLPPALSQPNVTSKGLQLKWAFSSSPDVVLYELFKRKAIKGGAEEWDLHLSFYDSLQSYMDTTCSYNQLYEYKLRAKDDAGLYSEYCMIVTGRLPFSKELLPLPEVAVKLNEAKALVSWSYQTPQNPPPGATSFKFLIYRSVGGEIPEEYAIVSETESSFEDTKIKKGGLYNYAVQVMYDTKMGSKLSKVRSVLFE